MPAKHRFTVLVGRDGSLYTRCLTTWSPWHVECNVLMFRHWPVLSVKQYSLRAGFEPAREDPIGFQVQRLNHSAITARNLKTASSIGILRTYGAQSMTVFNGESSREKTPVFQSLYDNQLCKTPSCRCFKFTFLYLIGQLWKLGHCCPSKSPCAVGRIRTCAGRAQQISSLSP